MLFFQKYTQINNHHQQLKNSIVFYIFNNFNKEIQHKSNNVIRGYYKDNILKKNIYLSSNGLKHSSAFSQIQLNPLIFDLKNLFYVSYFSGLETKLFKFNFFSREYLKDFLNKYFQQQGIIASMLQKTKSLHKQPSSKFFKTIKLSKYNYTNKMNFLYNKIVFIKNSYKKFYYMTEKGLIRTVHRNFAARYIFTGLIWILSEDIKKIFKRVLMLHYLLLNFYSKINLLTKKNSLVFYNLILYTNLLKYFTNQFVSYLKVNKLHFRRSNSFLYKFRWLYVKKAKILLNFFYLTNLNNLKISENSNSWIQLLLFQKKSYFNPFTSIEIQNSSRWIQILSLPISTKLKLLKLVYYYLQIIIPNKIFIHNYFTNNNLYIYIVLKAFIFKQFIYKYTNLRQKYNLYSIFFSSYDLFINKTVKLNQIYFSLEKFYFFLKVWKFDFSEQDDIYKLFRTINYRYFFLKNFLKIKKKLVSRRKIKNRRLHKKLLTLRFKYVKKYKWNRKDKDKIRRTLYYVKNKFRRLIKEKNILLFNNYVYS